MSIVLDNNKLKEIIKKHIENFQYYKLSKYRYYEKNLEIYLNDVKEIVSYNFKKCLVAGPNIYDKRYEEFIIIKFKNSENEICCLNVVKSKYS